MLKLDGSGRFLYTPPFEKMRKNGLKTQIFSRILTQMSLYCPNMFLSISCIKFNPIKTWNICIFQNICIFLAILGKICLFFFKCDFKGFLAKH